LSEKTARSPLPRPRLPSERLVPYVCDFMQRVNIHVLLELPMHFFLGDSVGASDEGIRCLKSRLENDILVLVVQQVAHSFCRRGCFLCPDFTVSLTGSICR